MSNQPNAASDVSFFFSIYSLFTFLHTFFFSSLVCGCCFFLVCFFFIHLRCIFFSMPMRTTISGVLITIVYRFCYIWFDSFVQEFVAAPLDGVSLLLEVLRSIQLSQQNGIGQTNTTGKMNAQTYQRRALLDELACLYVYARI